MEKSLCSLRSAGASARPFLSALRWKALGKEIGALQGASKEQVDKMKNEFVKTQERHKRINNNCTDRLADVEIVDSAKTVASRRAPVMGLLRKTKKCVHLLVRVADTDKWDQSASRSESAEAAQK